MTQVVVTSNLNGRSLSIKAVLSVHLAHVVAEAFTSSFDPDYPLHVLLRDLTVHNAAYRRYCIDQSSLIYTVTFSNHTEPRILTFQGAPALIAPSDQETLKIYLEQTDLVRPGRLNPNRTHPHAIQDLK